jgi:uroporphyrinogen decarboxylase
MCKTPELAAEVTVQPVDIVGVDAAIIFSDILVVPEAMGMKLELVESRGPRFDRPVRTRDDVAALRVVDPEKGLRFVMEAIGSAKRVLAGRVPLIGFAGSPWTLATYMIEGGSSKEFKFTKQMMLDDPDGFRALLDKLASAVRFYLEAQIAAGADAVQIFDTWGGALAPDHFKRFSLDYIFKIVSNMSRDGAPVIVFSKGANHSLKDIAEVGADVVSVDWTVDMADVRNLIGDRVSIQGNLDPAALYASPERIRQEVKSILRKYGKGTGHVFNLGHGISPDVPVDHAKAFVRAVKEESVAYHN